MARVEPGGAGVTLELERDEAVVVGRLLDDMTALLRQGDDDDAVQRRLFPDAYDDAEEARRFRDMVEGELRTAKLQALDSMRARLGSGEGSTIELEPGEVELWLRGLTDLRLALGTRLDVTEERMSEDLDPDDPDAAPLGLLHWLGWLQEVLIESLRRVQGDDDEQTG